MTNHLAYPRAFHPVYQHSAVEELAFPLTPDELRTYRDKGYVIIRQAIDAETIEALREECDRLVEGAVLDGTNMRYTSPFEQDEVPWKIDPCVDISPIFAAFARDRRICDRLCSIYDGFNPRLFKDKMIIKPAGGHGNGLHQDYNWWQGFPGSLLSVTIPLDATTRENGCTEFWTGYEQGFRHTHGTQDTTSFELESLKDEEHIYAEMLPGDIAIFTCMTPHAASPNNSDAPRRAMFLSYNDSRDGEWREAHYEHFFAYMAKSHDLDERRKLHW